MFAQEQSDQGLQCWLKSSLVRVYSVCLSIVESGSTVFEQKLSDQGLQCLLKSSAQEQSDQGP